MRADPSPNWTQIVWKSTTAVGCGAAWCPAMSAHYVVCQCERACLCACMSAHVRRGGARRGRARAALKRSSLLLPQTTLLEMSLASSDKMCRHDGAPCCAGPRWQPTPSHPFAACARMAPQRIASIVFHPLLFVSGHAGNICWQLLRECQVNVSAGSARYRGAGGMRAAGEKSINREPCQTSGLFNCSGTITVGLLSMQWQPPTCCGDRPSSSRGVRPPAARRFRGPAFPSLLHIGAELAEHVARGVVCSRGGRAKQARPRLAAAAGGVPCGGRQACRPACGRAGGPPTPRPRPSYSRLALAHYVARAGSRTVGSAAAHKLRALPHLLREVAWQGMGGGGGARRGTGAGGRRDWAPAWPRRPAPHPWPP